MDEVALDVITPADVANNIPPPSQPPSVCRIVIVTTPAGESPAIITRVWSPTTVNVSVFQDGHAHVLPLTSVTYDEARGPFTWSWPPRV